MRTKRTRRSRAQIAAIVRQWPHSGLNVEAEARRLGVGTATIQRWRKLVKSRTSPDGAAEFLEIPLPNAHSGATPALRLSWPDGFALEWLGPLTAETAHTLLRGLGRS
jgi:transposase-like protein